MLSLGWRQPDGELYFCRLAVTPEHPIRVNGKRWKAAGKLRNTYPNTYVESLLSDEAQVVSNVRLFATEQPGVAWRPMSSLGSALGEVGSHVHVETFNLLESGVALMFESVRKTKRVKPEHLYRTTVYNFEVEDFHTYYVGEAGIWVYAP